MNLYGSSTLFLRTEGWCIVCAEFLSFSVNPQRVFAAMEICGVKDLANNRPTLISRFAPHQVVSEIGVSHGTLEEIAGVPSPWSYWRLSGDFLLEEKGYGAELFHTCRKVGEKVCATMTVHDSSINAIGIDMVEKLQLSMTPQ